MTGSEEQPFRESEGWPLEAAELSLQQLVLESPDIKAFLTELAMLASTRLSVPGNTIHSGVTVLRHKRPQAVAASDPAAWALDELQNGFGQGPCLTALRQGSTLLVPDLAGEDRWRPYVRTAAEHGGPRSLPSRWTWRGKQKRY